MALAVLGATHRDVTVAQLEQLSSGADGLLASLSAGVRTSPGAESANGPAADEADGPAAGAIAGVVVLATCNRLEIYLDTALFHDAISAATAALAASSGLSSEEVGGLLRLQVGDDVAQHLFAVAAGLDSMVVGDESIASQVGQALQASHAAGATTATLQRLFQSALRVARQVAGQTQLGASGRSVVQVALDVAESQAGATLAGGRALIVGTGAFARVAVGALRRRQIGEIRIFSPSGRADDFAQSHDATAVSATGLVDALRDADVVVCTSGSTGSVIDAAMLRAARGDAPTVAIDLALTPDLAPDVHQLPNVTVIDLDVVARNAPVEQAGTLDDARALVEQAVQRHREDTAARALDPAIVALREHVTKMLTRELERVRERGDAEQAEQTEQALRRLTSALLHLPTVRARELARTGDHADYVAALQTLFGIEVPAQLAD
jgi:glutamyl-tRNA reductase